MASRLDDHMISRDLLSAHAADNCSFGVSLFFFIVILRIAVRDICPENAFAYTALKAYMNKVAENADHGSFSPDTGLAAHALIDTAAFICFHIDRIADLTCL